MRQPIPLFYVIPKNLHVKHRHLIAESHAISLDSGTDFVMIEFRGPMERQQWESLSAVELLHPFCAAPLSTTMVQALSAFNVSSTDSGWNALEKIGATYPHFRV